MPRALNDPVGLRASSFTQTFVSTGSKGVDPSASEISSPSSSGKTSRYRHSVGARPAKSERLSLTDDRS